MRNNRAGLPSFIALFFVTFFVAAILITFVVLSGLVKSFSEVKNGEKIYNDGEVGVGDIKDSMKDYERLVAAKILIRNGESVDDALVLEEYGERPDFFADDYYGGYLPIAISGVFYD